ncbi:MAG TPA: hypothetical protein VHL56_10355 [Candidatus Limnocylindrales bacterium]|jgi:hypothetical protein|nr:hypothetical protein [Candidatus Limnocylindrales bacterium]
MSLWFRIQEFVVEIALRLVKLVLATIFGLLVYWVLTGPMGAPGSAQLALEAWIAGALILLILETGIF